MKMNRKLKKISAEIYKPYYNMFFISICIAVLGILMITSATYTESGLFYVSRQVILIHIATQVVVNMGVCTSLLPNTGLPLVLMSYGGSSILTSFAELAICVSVSKKSVVKVSKKIAKEELG